MKHVTVEHSVKAGLGHEAVAWQTEGVSKAGEPLKGERDLDSETVDRRKDCVARLGGAGVAFGSRFPR